MKKKKTTNQRWFLVAIVALFGLFLNPCITECNLPTKI
jgi:hypothetical protein